MAVALTTSEPTILDNGLRFTGHGHDPQHLEYAWFRYRDPRGEHTKVVVLRELAYLPREVREDPDILGKQWAALRGLYNAGVDFVYSTCGIFDRPQGPLGIVQFYGAAAEAASEEAAAALAQRRIAAVEALLSNFPQSRLRPPETERVAWWIDALAGFPHSLALLGMPDPRKTRRGLGDPDSSAYAGAAGEELTSQQNELLFRGLAKIREEFVFLTLAQHIRRGVLAQMLEGLSDLTSVYASQQRGVRSIGFSIGLPLITSLGLADSQAHSTSQAEGRSYAESVGEALSEADGRSWATAHSEARSLSKGEFQSQSAGHSSNWSAGKGVAYTSNWSRGESESQGTAEGTAHTTSSATSNTSGSSHSTFSSTSSSQGVSNTTSWGTSHSQSSGGSQSHTDSSGQGQSAGLNVGTSSSHTDSSGQGQSAGLNVGTSSSHTASSGVGSSQSDTAGVSAGVSAGVNASASGQVGIPGTGVGGSVGGTVGGSVGASQSHTDATSQNAGVADTTGQSAGVSFGSNSSTGQADSSGHSAGFSAGVSQNQGQADSSGTNWGSSTTDQSGGSTTTTNTTTTSSGSSDSSFSSTTHTSGVADTRSHVDSHSTSESQAVGGSITHSTFSSAGGGVFASTSTGQSVTRTMTEGATQSVGGSHVEGRTESRAQSTGLSSMDGLGRTAGAALSGGFSAGLSPGISLGRSWQTEDEKAMRVTQLLRGLTDVVNMASHEGGFVVDAYLFTRTQRGQEAAAALVPQAFHGPAAAVPTPVLTSVEDAGHLRRHALTFQNCGLEDPLGPLSLSGTRLGSLLTAEMLAAYTAPGVFEEGTALTTQERLPPLALYPDLDGVHLGSQYSPETADLTATPLRLAEKRRFHTVFAADTGFGKSVAAERLALESTLAWRMRTVVLDFGAGWRKLLNAPALAGHVDFYTLQPGGVRPLAWNPLQIGRRLPPEVQWRAFADIFGAVARLGVKRQVGELRNALRALYLEAGVLVDDPDLPERWKQVTAEDETALNAERAARGLPPSASSGQALNSLLPWERQAAAVHRSRVVGLAGLYREIELKMLAVPARDVMLRGVLEGILYRLHPLVQGAAAEQYRARPGGSGVAIEDLGLPWGLTVVEGGAFLDEFSKAFLLGWLAWHLYTDSVQRRQENIGRTMQPMQIFFEEANKILSGVDSGGGEEDSGAGGAAATAQQFETMWRDSRKYGIYLHPMVQSPALLAPGILSSCANVFAGQLKNPKDRDILVAALGRSEKGFQDEEWRRFLARLAVGQFVVKLGYSLDMADLEPMLVRPARVALAEPADADILQLFKT